MRNFIDYNLKPRIAFIKGTIVANSEIKMFPQTITKVTRACSKRQTWWEIRGAFISARREQVTCISVQIYQDHMQTKHLTV